MSKKQKITTEKGKKEIPIEWNVPENIISHYASHVLVDVIENEFTISFYELKPPIRTDPKDPLPQSVRADCIANIIASPQTIQRLIGALQTQLNMFIEAKTKEVKS
jgi:hypothetical protein